MNISMHTVGACEPASRTQLELNTAGRAMALLAILTGLSMVTAATLTAGPAIPSSGTAPVTDEQTAAWRREVLPLPKELRIESVLELHPGAVGIRAAGPGNALVVQAVKELRTVFQDKAGVPPDGRVFEIVVGLLDKDGRLDGMRLQQAEKLRGVRNADQGYIIEPQGTNRLTIAGYGAKGVYYGALTYRQWLARHVDGNHVHLPLARVLDWPDFEVRGFWHPYMHHIPWLTSMKFNRFHLTVRIRINPDRTVSLAPLENRSGRLEPGRPVPYELARERAAEVVPDITHLDMWDRNISGFREYYPDLAGKGEQSKSDMFSTKERPGQRVPCTSNPALVPLLAAMMRLHAKDGASQVDGWVSEFPGGQCACEACLKKGQYQGEVRAFIEAWRSIRNEWPNLKLSVFFGSGGYVVPPTATELEREQKRLYPEKAMDEILAAWPPEMELRVSQGIKNATLEAFNKKGGFVSLSRMACLNSNRRWYCDQAQKILQAMKAASYRGAIQRAPPVLTRFYDFQMSAIAEYAWNADGRTPDEFAEAWALNQGCAAPPERILEWFRLMQSPAALRQAKSPAQSDLRKQAQLKNWLKRLPENIAAGLVDPELGQENAETLKKNAAIAGAMLEATRTLDNNNSLALAARTMAAYCELEWSGYEWMALAAADKTARAAGKSAYDESLKKFRPAMRKYAEARQSEIKQLGSGPVAEEAAVPDGSDALEQVLTALEHPASQVKQEENKP